MLKLKVTTFLLVDFHIKEKKLRSHEDYIFLDFTVSSH